MLTKTILKKYDCTINSEYFEFINEMFDKDRINFSKSLYNKLSELQKKDFADYTINVFGVSSFLKSLKIKV